MKYWSFDGSFKTYGENLDIPYKIFKDILIKTQSCMIPNIF